MKMDTFPTVFHGYTLTKEEEAVLDETLRKMREERRKAEEIKKNTERIWGVVTLAVDTIGLKETERIVRDIDRDLRRMKE
jgi:hypothetical protein